MFSARTRWMTPVSICCHSAAVMHAGDQVERQDAVDRGGVGIDGEGDAALQQVALGVHGAAAQGFDRELGQAGAAAVRDPGCGGWPRRSISQKKPFGS